MNIIEATNFFVRVTCFDFKNRNENIKLKFRIIPMIHIGSKAYYEDALAYLEECDEIIYEGVLSKRPKISQSFGIDLYKKVADQLNLVTQNEYLNLQSLSTKLVHADYIEETENTAWKALKFKEKILLRLIMPVQSYYDSWTLTRKKLAKRFMHSYEELYLAYGQREDEPRTVSNYLMHAREQIIFRTIDKKMDKGANEEKLIGILYGAGHMKTICRYLIDKLGYVPHNGNFLKVFTI